MLKEWVVFFQAEGEHKNEGEKTPWPLVTSGVCYFDRIYFKEIKLEYISLIFLQHYLK